MRAASRTPGWLNIVLESGQDDVIVTALHGSEAISTAYEFVVDLCVPSSSSIDFNETVGRSARIEWTYHGSTSTRYLHGIVRKLTERHVDDAWLHYRAEIVPQFRLLENNIQSRIFQRVTASEILHVVLGGLKRVAFELKGNYVAHNYCVQYAESDFEFANRLMAEEGFHYYFRHAKDGPEELVLSDRSSANPMLAAASTLRYQPARGSTLPEGRVFRWRKRQSIRTGKFVVRDRHFQLPKADLQSIGNGPEVVRCGSVEHRLSANMGECYEPIGGFADRQDGVGNTGSAQPDNLNKLFDDSNRLAKIGVERLTCDAVTTHAVSNVSHVLPGCRFELEAHRDGNGGYLLLRVDHEARQSPDRTHQGEDFYQNEFECIPHTVEYRPPRTYPRPQPGPQSAIVVGPPGENIYTDKYGRVKVQFLWDRTGRNADSSCWLRVRQPHAGGKFGMLTIPRVGYEVLVGFEHGDCDRPIVLASLYHADHPVPFPTPANRTQLGFKVRSKNGDAPNFSGLAIEDNESSPHVQFHSERDATFSTENHIYVNAASQHHAVKKQHFRLVGNLPFVDHTQTRGAPSGTGGAADDSSGEGGDAMTNAGPFNWNPNVPGATAFNKNITIGHKSEQVLGIFTETYFGNHLEPLWNPIGFAAAMAMPLSMGVSFWPGAMFFGGVPAQGNASIVMGTSSSAVYGPSYKIQRGPVVELKANLTMPAEWKALDVGILAAALSYTCVVTGQLFINGMEPSLKANLVGAVATLLQELTLSIWVGLEAGGQSVKMSDTAIKTVRALEAYAMSLTDGGIASSEQLAAWMVQTGQRAANNVAGALGSSIEVEDSIEDAELGVPEYQMGDGAHFVAAPGIKLMSLGQPMDVERAMQIRSLGPVGGVVNFFGGNALHMQAGTLTLAQIDMVAEEVTGLITIDHSPLGSTMIKTGPLPAPACMPFISVSPTGIEIMAETMISLVVGEMTITLLPAAIEIVNGATSISITPAAIETTSPAIMKIADGSSSGDAPDSNEDSADKSVVAGVVQLI